MPFDALTTNLTLSDAALRLGIVPVPRAILNAHKQNEIRKHPASWWYHHVELAERLLFVGFFSSICIAVATGVVALMSLMSGNGTVGLMFLGVTIIATVVFNRICAIGALTGRGPVLKGPAFWTEHYGSHMAGLLKAPDEMLERAHELQDMVPGSIIVVGELLQNEVSLDPYLLVRHHDDEVILAIWDKTGVLYQAE